jgi:hypothetical protein
MALAALINRPAGLSLGMAFDSEKALEQEIASLLISGEAADPSQAERLFLERHLQDVIDLVNGPLSDFEFRRHPLISLLFSHGSRGFEDSLR